jgi:hypothetical protein
MMPYDPSADTIPPPTSVADELMTVNTSYGPMEKWKARALAIGWFQRAVDSVRADSADGVGPAETCADPDELPPPVVADDTPPDVRAGELTADDLALIERAVDDLENRIGAMESRQRAYRALLDAEARIEQELGIDPEDQEDEPTLKLN